MKPEMSESTQHGILFLTYAIIVVWRLRRIGMRWSLPLMRGTEYFLGLRVPEGFLAARGAALLAAYRRWLVLPWMIEATAAVALASTGQLVNWIVTLIVGGTVLELAAWILLLKRMRKTIKPFAIEEPPTAIALPLETRTVGAYTKPWIEALIVGMLVTSSALILWHGGENRFRIVLIGAYVQLGLFLIKQAVVALRTRVPVENADGYHQLHEYRRHLYVNQCDWLRGFAALFMVVLTVEAFYGADAGRWMSVIWLGITIIMMSAMAREARTVMQLSAALKPLKPKPVGLSNGPQDSTSVFLYRPDYPAMLLRRRGGYALNFGSPRTLISVAYLIGALILGAATMHAETPATIEGRWTGILGGRLHVAIVFKQEANNAWKAVLESPDQGPETFDASSVKLDGAKLHIEFGSLQASFDGAFERDSLHGTWTQGIELPLNLTRAAKNPPQ